MTFSQTQHKKEELGGGGLYLVISSAFVLKFPVFFLSWSLWFLDSA